MAKKVKAHWERSKKPKMMLAHFSVDELKAFDTLQGGPSLDPETGIREYSALREIIKQPEVLALFHEVTRLVVDDLTTHGKLSAPLNKVYKDSKKSLLPFRETEEEKESPQIKSLEALGIGGDTKLALIPTELAELLIDIRGGPSINPNTGLLMFGFFQNPFKAISRTFSKPRNLVRLFTDPVGHVIPQVRPITSQVLPIAASIFGTMYGGPAGGAAASAAARGITGYTNNESPEQIQRGMAGSALASLGSNYGGHLGLSPAVGAGLGQTGGQMLMGDSFGNAARAGVGTGLGYWGAGQFGYGPSAGGGAAGSGAGQFGNQASSASANAGLSSSAQAAKAVADKAAGVGAGGLFSSLGNLIPGGASSLLIPAAIGGLSYMGSQKKYKEDKANHERELARENHNKEAMGYNDPWIPVKSRTVNVRKNPAYYSSSDASRRGIYASPWLYEGDPGYETAYDTSYAKGGQVKASWENPSHHDQSKLQSPVEGVLIKGPGKGQQDKIKTTVPENCYIIDASSTGMFGDGSSDAGAKVLKEFEEQIKNKFPKRKAAEIYHQTDVSSRQLPVYLSDSEYKFDPVTVTMLGKGSNVKGAAMLKGMVKNLRAHKSIRGGGLPPKAKSPWAYIQARG